MSDKLADSEMHGMVIADSGEDTVGSIEHISDAMLCPCCGAKVRAVTARVAVDTTQTTLEFISYKA